MTGIQETPGTPTMQELLRDSPKNWGKWGPDDEVGSLNYLTVEEAQRGAAEIRSGKTFTLAIPIGNPGGDPIWPGRKTAVRTNVMDREIFFVGKAPASMATLNMPMM